MANCRCGEISRCENQIRILSAAESRFIHSDHYIKSFEVEKQEISTSYPYAFISGKARILGTETRGVNSEIKTARGSVASRIASRKSSLSTELGNMRSEDAQHHEEERRAREEEERQRQAAVRLR